MDQGSESSSKIVDILSQSERNVPSGKTAAARMQVSDNFYRSCLGYK